MRLAEKVIDTFEIPVGNHMHFGRRMIMKKVIGIIPLYDDERESYWMLPGYMKMLEAEHAIPMMLPLTADPKELDYFLEICGGFCSQAGMMSLRRFIRRKRQSGAVHAVKCGIVWKPTS